MSYLAGKFLPVSIAELRGGNPELERTPPQDLIAEQSALGGMLLSKDAISDVVEILKSRDFYRPAHELSVTLSVNPSNLTPWQAA